MSEFLLAAWGGCRCGQKCRSVSLPSHWA